jgi:hypothetical protein
MGINTSGQLGTGDNDNEPSPTEVRRPIYLFSITPTGIRPRYNDYIFNFSNDPFVHVSNFEIISGTNMASGVSGSYPDGLMFSPGDVIKLSPTQNRYSFDYYEIWPPNKIINSSNAYPTQYGFIASYDPYTEVQVNHAGNITGQFGKIIARYR